MNLRDIENQGYQLTVESGRLAVIGPTELLTEDRLEALRKHKKELIDQVLLRDFCTLVRAYGVEHQVLLTDSQIIWELNADDIARLREIDRYAKQQWAETLAHRLTKGWTAADRITELMH